MKKNLVTSLVEETFDSNSLNILLGDWCNPFNSSSELFKHSEVFDYHWNDSKKMETDYSYLYSLHEKTIKHLTVQMNKIHQENQTERYWRIILGPWLISLISILWDRWESLRLVFEKLNMDTCKHLNYETKNLIASDFFEFSKLRSDHDWNHIIFSEIIKFNYVSKIKVEIIEKKKKVSIGKYTANYHNYNNIKINYFIKFFDFLIKHFCRRSRIILYESYFGFFNKILLSLSLGESPRSFSEFEKKIMMPNPKKRDHIKLEFQAKNEFENFYKFFFFKLMPVSYLEGYKTLLAKSKKINGDAEIIFTASGHEGNDFFKIWTANQVRNGKKYIVCEHGGCWENNTYFGNLEKTADLFLTWNRYGFKNSIQVPINIDLKKKKILKKNIGSKILLLGNHCGLYCNRIQTGPLTGQILKDYQIWKICSQKLSPKIKENLIFRPHPHDIWNLGKKYAMDFGEKYVTNKKQFEKDINRSKVIIDTSFQTTFYQIMKIGIPTIILFDRKILNMDPKLSKLLNLFIKNKIFFDSPYEASKHINEIWDNSLHWWNSKKVLEARNLFTEYCSIEKENNFAYWKKLLKNQMNGQINDRHN
uniref:Uncharacterized protein n=1 Tax=uncultured marine bacterium 440 TaxID=257390 RepID=Q6SHC2_9BACT|nr:conserved hypothetical protein [uncultured marine bacterium 440]